ncbi:MAG: DUF1127 domain-containing protein [Maritimibacter sp.]|nr:DUF1127 domain-containing protein [Maritimibacter sp.]
MFTTLFFNALTIGTSAPGRTRMGLQARIQRGLRMRRDYQKLEDLPDYLLEDIGLTRSDVRDARRFSWF